MSNQPRVFEGYAQSYDMLYADKDYQRECDFIEEVLQRYNGALSKCEILDLGCGTGGHAIPLAQRGYSVWGIDFSPAMIELAQEKSSECATGKLQFQVGNIQSAQLKRSFGAVICMFAVIGYQTTNAELFTLISNVRRHLQPGGVFICDFWFGPAVLRERPVERIKEIKLKNERLIRIARPELCVDSHVVTVNYHLLRIFGDKVLEEIREAHRMRFLFKPELEFMLTQAGLTPVTFCDFGKLDAPASELTWNVSAVAQLQG